MAFCVIFVNGTKTRCSVLFGSVFFRFHVYKHYNYIYYDFTQIWQASLLFGGPTDMLSVTHFAKQ